MQLPNLGKMWKKFNESRKKPAYPITAVIRCKRRGGSVVVIDRLRRVDRTTFQRLSNSHIFEAPELSEVDILSTGGNFVELWNPEFKVYVPLRFEENKDAPLLKEASTNYLNWAKEKTREIRLRHVNKKSKMEELMPIALPLVTGVAISLILYMASENWKQIAPLTSALRNIVSTLSQASQTSGVKVPIGG